MTDWFSQNRPWIWGFLFFDTRNTLYNTCCINISWCKHWLCELFLLCVALNLQFIPFQYIIIQRDCYLLGIWDFGTFLKRIFFRSWKLHQQNLPSIYCETFVNPQYILMPVMLHVFAKINEATNESDTQRTAFDTVERECTTFNW